MYFSPGLGNEVFAVEFDTWTGAAKTDDGMMKEVLTLDANDVERVEI